MAVLVEDTGIFKENKTLNYQIPNSLFINKFPSRTAVYETKKLKWE